MTEMPPPGWYPDGLGNMRWWDGAQWAAVEPLVADLASTDPPLRSPRKRRVWPWAVLGVVGLVMIAAALAGPSAKTKSTAASSPADTTAAVVLSAATSSSASTTAIDTPTGLSSPAVPSTHSRAPTTHQTSATPIAHVTRHSAPPPTRATSTHPAFNYCGAPANPWHYNFCSGSLITNPAANVCSYFNCIANFSNGVGYMVQCNDGTFSMSGGRRGACSSHSGEGRSVYMP
jgi:hypothetical protein